MKTGGQSRGEPMNNQSSDILLLLARFPEPLMFPNTGQQELPAPLFVGCVSVAYIKFV